jgi:hypothetical protein
VHRNTERQKVKCEGKGERNNANAWNANHTLDVPDGRGTMGVGCCCSPPLDGVDSRTVVAVEVAVVVACSRYGTECDAMLGDARTSFPLFGC